MITTRLDFCNIFAYLTKSFLYMKWLRSGFTRMDRSSIDHALSLPSSDHFDSTDNRKKHRRRDDAITDRLSFASAIDNSSIRRQSSKEQIKKTELEIEMADIKLSGCLIFGDLRFSFNRSLIFQMEFCFYSLQCCISDILRTFYDELFSQIIISKQTQLRVC